MIGQLSDIFRVLLSSAVLSIGISPLAIRLASKLNLMDLPGSAPHKRHASPTPLAGGIVLVASILLVNLVLRPQINSVVIGIFVAALVMFLVGIVDDRFGLAPILKLAGQGFATLILVLFGVEVGVLSSQILDLALTFLWVLGITNAFNFVDSIDGLALGLSSIASAFFMLVALDSAQPELALLSATLLGITFGAYFFNAAPAKLFLGDSGAQLLGLMLAAIGIAYTPAQAGLPQAVSWFTPILVLGVPIFDTSLVVYSRLRRRLPIYKPGLDHTFHRLIRIGLDQARATLAMQLTSIILGLIAFIALDASVLIANLLFGGIVLVGIIALIYLESATRHGLDETERLPSQADSELE